MTDVHSSPIPAGPAAGHPADEEDPACDVAHGAAPAPEVTRTLVAVFDSPVARYLLRYAGDAGFRPVLVEPDPQHAGPAEAGVIVADGFDGYLGGSTDVVVTDHHRPELGPMLRDALAGQTRWVGVMGNPRHPAPHIPALAALGVADADIARVHRPIGLNIGSRTPAEIAVATLVGPPSTATSCPGLMPSLRGSGVPE